MAKSRKKLAIPILKRLVEQLKAKGMSVGMANAVARKRLQQSGNLKKGKDEATAKGKKRSKMGAAGRAKSRAAKESGRKPSDYKYNSSTNRATLKNG
tara:strand:+ start:375 stop:665 length:291 start_codon:yes stop_codon:yes gene_type:complete